MHALAVIGGGAAGTAGAGVGANGLDDWAARIGETPSPAAEENTEALEDHKEYCRYRGETLWGYPWGKNTSNALGADEWLGLCPGGEGRGGAGIRW